MVSTHETQREVGTHPSRDDPPVVCVVVLTYTPLGHEAEVDGNSRQDGEDDGDDYEGRGDDRDHPRARTTVGDRHVWRASFAGEAGRLSSEGDIAVTVFTGQAERHGLLEQQRLPVLP